MESAMGGSTASASGTLAYPGADRVERRVGDRRAKSRFVLRERRLGWERRADDHRRPRLVPERVHMWFRSVPWAMPAVLIAANLLSLVDIFLTMKLLATGAQEANPFLRVLMDIDIRVAAGAKGALVATATLLIWRYRHHRKMLPLAFLAAGAFAAVVMYEALLLLTA